MRKLLQKLCGAVGHTFGPGYYPTPVWWRTRSTCSRCGCHRYFALHPVTDEWEERATEYGLPLPSPSGHKKKL